MERAKEIKFKVGVTNSGEVVCKELCALNHMIVCGGSDNDRISFLRGLVSDLVSDASAGELQLFLSNIGGAFTDFAIDESFLWHPITTNCRKTVAILDDLRNECLRRYALFEKSDCKTISEFNGRISSGHGSKSEKLPYIAVVLDEILDMTYIENNAFYHSLLRLVSISRAVGIRLIISTHSTRIGKPINAAVRSSFQAIVCFKTQNVYQSLALIDTADAVLLNENSGEFLYMSADFNDYKLSLLRSAEIHSRLLSTDSNRG